MSKFLTINHWTDNNFNDITWHDNTIHGLYLKEDMDGFINELYFDIDHILEWIKPIEPDGFFNFLISPSTLVFKDVHNLKIDIDSGSTTTLSLQIENLYNLGKINKSSTYFTSKWHIELQNGDIFFEAKGFQQNTRRRPIFTNKQRLSLNERGGISFDIKFDKL